MANSLQSTSGYVGRAAGITYDGTHAMVQGGAFYITGNAGNGLQPVVVQNYKTSGGNRTGFEIYQTAADDPSVPNRIFGYFRNASFSNVDIDLGPNSTFIGKWTHWCWTISAAGSGHFWVLQEGFNPLSPSYLTTPSQGTVESGFATYDLVQLFHEYSDSTTIGTTIIQAAYYFAQTEFSEAQFLEKCSQRAPTSALTSSTYTFLDLSSASTPGTDSGNTASNFSATGTFSAIASEPSEWSGGAPPTVTKKHRTLLGVGA